MRLMLLSLSALLLAALASAHPGLSADMIRAGYKGYGHGGLAGYTGMESERKKRAADPKPLAEAYAGPGAGYGYRGGYGGYRGGYGGYRRGYGGYGRGYGGYGGYGGGYGGYHGGYGGYRGGYGGYHG